nr:MAG TPA: hypothetical protein [Caudoviricetes sp.]
MDSLPFLTDYDVNSFLSLHYLIHFYLYLRFLYLRAQSDQYFHHSSRSLTVILS